MIVAVNNARSVSTKITTNSLQKEVRAGFFINSSMAAASEKVLGGVKSFASLDIDKSLKESPYYNLATAAGANSMEVLAKALQGNNVELFGVPFYNKTKVNGGDINSVGAMAGVGAKAGDGVLNFYVGYESSKSDFVGQDFDDKTLYLGINYYLPIYAEGFLKDTYFKTTLRGSYTDSDLTRSSGDEANIKNSSVGIGAWVGKQFEIGADDRIKAEIGLGVDRYNFGSFSIAGEHYYSNTLNLFSADASATYAKKLGENTALSFSLGAKTNLNNTSKSKVFIESLNTTADIKADMPRFYGYGELGLEHWFSESFSVSANYNYLQAKDIKSHTGYIKASYKF